RTLEWFWNVKTAAFFRAPEGAQVKIRYDWKDRQKKTLDGVNYKKLTIGKWSIFTARIQIKVPRDTEVTYDVDYGNVAISSPSIPF
ncbi:MAG: hypothetical protein PHU81_09880, partial [Acidobacteriota bacterium]|nr:hypothetical protein [Acidobacteriota bacterium]